MDAGRPSGNVSPATRMWLSGRASPCQGEGRGFESRHPLGTSGADREISARVRWSGREARQRPAKPSTRVQIPSPPRSPLRSTSAEEGPVARPGRAIGAAVARFPDTEEVTGSIPVSPTEERPGQTPSPPGLGVLSCPAVGCTWATGSTAWAAHTARTRSWGARREVRGGVDEPRRGVAEHLRDLPRRHARQDARGRLLAQAVPDIGRLGVIAPPASAPTPTPTATTRPTGRTAQTSEAGCASPTCSRSSSPARSSPAPSGSTASRSASSHSRAQAASPSTRSPSPTPDPAPPHDTAPSVATSSAAGGAVLAFDGTGTAWNAAGQRHG